MLEERNGIQLQEPENSKPAPDGYAVVQNLGAVVERRLWEEMLKIVIPVEPRTKKNSQQLVMVRNRMIPIPSKKYKEFEKKCGLYLKEHQGLNICEPVNVCYLFYMPTRRTVDLTNLQAAADDMLVHFKVLEDDNSNIIAGHDGSRVCLDRENPRIEITITKMKASDIDVKMQKMREEDLFRDNKQWETDAL